MEAVAGALGRHWESRNGMSMWRDYGLVEFFYEQRSHGRGWRGSHFSVHMHRLKYGRARDRRKTVGDAVMARYGRKWRRWLTFAALKGELDRRGVMLVEVDYGLPYAREYWQRDAEISVLVNADGDYPGEIDEVLKISSNGRGGRQRRLSDEQMRALLEMGEAERNWWLAKGRESELAGVWRYACGSAWGHDEKRRAEWAGLFRWAMCRGRELGLATGAEEAW
jgi:hypothetical protein